MKDTDEQVNAVWNEGVQLMAKGYTWAEAILQVLRKTKSWDATPYQWATVGFKGAVMSGKTICGVLFGATIYLGYLNGINATGAPGHKDRRRKRAIASVEDLFNGFTRRFGYTDCQTLTGCDWTKKKDIKRYFKEEVYKDTCFPQLEYVVEKCIVGNSP